MARVKWHEYEAKVFRASFGKLGGAKILVPPKKKLAQKTFAFEQKEIAPASLGYPQPVLNKKPTLEDG